MCNIKKFRFVVVILIILFLFQAEASAVFSITLNYFSIDFGNMNMGAVKDDVPPIGLTVTCTTDQGNPWFLKIRNDFPLTHTFNPASTISNANFKWYGLSTTGGGTLVTTREDFTFEKTVYTGLAAEGASGIDITMKFELTLPTAIQSGTYNTNVVFTLTE